MSQTKQWSANLGNTVRVRRSNGAKEGSGNNTRLYVGYYSGYDYDSYLRFALDWTGVGRIVSAVLSLYTDDGLGIMDSTTNEHPFVAVQRLTTAFSEGVGPSSGFQTNDYTAPKATTSDRALVNLTRAVFGLNSIDITAMVEDWAPKTVQRRDGKPGGAASNFGVGLYGSADATKNWAGFSEDYSNATFRPIVTLTYEYAVTKPDTPGTLTPTGAVDSLTDFQGSFSDTDPSDFIAYSEVEVYTSAATNAGEVVTGGTRLYAVKKAATDTEKINARFAHVPDVLPLRTLTTYKWRARVYDNEGQVSLWTNLTSFSVNNTAPNAPVLSPVSGSSFTTLDGVQFGSIAFSDPDVGDTLLAYEVQMSAYPEGDVHWLDDEFILWNTGKRYVAADETSWQTPYGGAALDAGTYYWRARVYDSAQGVSNWAYATITTTQSFEPDPDNGQTSIQLRPRAPWRIVIKAMGALRGPGAVVASLEDAKNVGASLLFNSPGELHFTIPKDHPQIAGIEPKQTHYSVQFRQGDGWREVFAGLMWDFDASDTDVVFYGIDYLALLDYTLDERYDQSNPDKPSEKGGSKYVTAGKNSISYIVTDQLTRAKNLANSPVGFITVGAIASMTETLTVFSTYAPTLNFITGLLDSHRAGTGKKTRLSVRQKTGGGYEFVVQDDPGQVRDNLRMRYGELVQGYRVIPFGTDWASRISAIGRAKDGIAVLYRTATAPGIDEATWGRFTQVRLMDGISDENDLMRRTKQAAINAGKLGKSIALGLRSGILQPRDGYDVCDVFPIDIEDGSVSTAAFGSGYWVAMGITWTTEAQNGKQTTTLTLSPREDSTAPDSDLLTLQPISPQAEWQIGWTPPNPLTASSKYWLDQNTGIVYIREGGTLVIDGTLTGTA